MKIMYLLGAMPLDENNDALLKDRVASVFAELEAEFAFVDLGRVYPPFFYGETTVAVSGIIEQVRKCDGLIIASKAGLVPSAVLLNFLEYFQLTEYSQALDGKHVMLAVTSEGGGERSAINLLSGILSHYGAFVVSSVGLQKCHLADLDGDPGAFVDRACEDFYRAIRGKRRYIIPQDLSIAKSTEFGLGLGSAPVRKANPMARETFSNDQEKDVEELSRLFYEKYNPGQKSLPPKPEPPGNQAQKLAGAMQMRRQADALPSAEETYINITDIDRQTVKGITKNLPKFFQAHLSAGLRAVIQINIFGSEEFSGYLSIHSKECAYAEGQADTPDITIMSDAVMWMDVLGGKFTAQKAFMVGGLKVRGDFVLLSKFDTLFKIA